MGKRWQHTNSPSIHRAQFQCRLFHDFISWENDDPGTNHAGTGGTAGGTRQQGHGAPLVDSREQTASDTHPVRQRGPRVAPGNCWLGVRGKWRHKMLLLRSKLEAGGFPRAGLLCGVCLQWGVLRAALGPLCSRVLSLRDLRGGGSRALRSGEIHRVCFERRLGQGLFWGSCAGRERL